MCQSGPDSPRRGGAGGSAANALAVTRPRRPRRGRGPAATRAVAAFLAQLIGGRLARRRLDAARGAAAAIHAAYRGTDIVPSRGTLVDISI